MRIYGPVPSRRFGLSLGVDLVPHKACSFDCTYCQIGPTNRLVARPEAFYPIEDVINDVSEALEEGPRPDVITMAGSGEPTLFSPLGELIDKLKGLDDIPILLITNSSLLWLDEVAEAALKTDILAPSLDAGDEETYRAINQPHPDITFERVLSGLEHVTNAHKGQVRLEVMLMQGINDSDESMRSIARHVARLRCDQIDLNTPVRPPVPERGALPCSKDTLDRALEIFGPKAKSIGTFADRNAAPPRKRQFSDRDKDIREMLLRRPCTVSDICSSLGLHTHEVVKSIELLTNAGFVDARKTADTVYYHAPHDNPTLVNTKK